MNPTIGTDQKGKTFWKKMASNFYECCNGLSNERTQKSLTNRYSDIQRAVNKFIGILAQIENSRPSGCNELDKIQKVKAMYRKVCGFHFKFEHCWNILRNQPKWAETNGVIAKRRQTNT